MLFVFVNKKIRSTTIGLRCLSVSVFCRYVVLMLLQVDFTCSELFGFFGCIRIFMLFMRYG